MPLALAAASARWETTKGLVQAVELLDIAVVANDQTIGLAAARSIVNRPQAARPSVVEAADRYLSGRPVEAFEATFENGIPAQPTREKIHSIKLRMIDAPRDGLTAAELSRLYTLAGQRRKAQDWMRRALKLLPDNRYVLRSATRLFTHLNKPDEAIEAIWKSEAVRHDPWVQAAEVAVADQLERSPKWAGRARKSLNDGAVGISRSELAMALATLEWKSGSKLKTVRKLVNASLKNPTESSVAQALWLRDSAQIFLDISPHYSMAMANEAAALRAREAGNYKEAIKQAGAWGFDQPFSPRPFMLASTAADIFLNQPALSEEHCRRGMLYHPDNPSLLNGLIVSLAHQGKLSDAAALLPDLHATIGKNVEMEAYYHAASGLVAFGRGRHEEGRSQYLMAVEAARRNKLHSLSINAILYWIEQEALAKSFTLEDWTGINEVVEASIAKLPITSRLGAERVWKARRQYIDHAMQGSNDLQDDKVRFISCKKGDGFKLDRDALRRLTDQPGLDLTPDFI